jgi:hypothetical protein
MERLPGAQDIESEAGHVSGGLNFGFIEGKSRSNQRPDAAKGCRMRHRKPNDAAEVEFLLSRLNDGDLTDEESAAVEHLLEDDAWRATADQYERLNGTIRSLADEQPAVNWTGFREQVRMRIAADQPRRLVIPRLVRIFTPLAAAACLAVVASLYWLQKLDVPRPTDIASAPSEPVLKIAFATPSTITEPDDAKVMAVRFNRTPPSPDWKPQYDDLAPQSAVALCGPDPVRGTASPSQAPVF